MPLSTRLLGSSLQTTEHSRVHKGVLLNTCLAEEESSLAGASLPSESPKTAKSLAWVAWTRIMGVNCALLNWGRTLDSKHREKRLSLPAPPYPPVDHPVNLDCSWGDPRLLTQKQRDFRSLDLLCTLGAS